MFNILNTILVAAIVTVEVYGLFLGVYLMLFEGVTSSSSCAGKSASSA